MRLRPERRCRSCFFPADRTERLCPHCGYDGRALPAFPLPQGALLAGRYRAGALCGDAAQWGFDETTRTRVRLAVYAGAEHAAFFTRADALLQVADCALLFPVLDAFEQQGLAVLVSALPEGLPLSARAMPLNAAELMYALHAASDALLVLHSLPQMHGALLPENVYVTGDGALRLLLPAAPAGNDPAADICALGALLAPLHASIPRKLDRVLTHMREGRYASVLELKHALNCLETEEQSL